MGHVARLLEAAEISTVVIAARIFQPVLEPMALPRLLLTPHVMGRPIGPPGDLKRQRETLEAALELLKQAERERTIHYLPGHYRPGRFHAFTGDVKA